MCHEVAHLLAIAVEDEANFAGYLACEYSGDPVFQYSGYMMAYLYCSNELYKTDQEAWQQIRSQASAELLHDLNANNAVFQENQGAGQGHCPDGVSRLSPVQRPGRRR